MKGPYVRLLLPLYVFVAVWVVLILAGSDGSPDFYRAASSIIPTLLLTLAVAGRFFLPDPSRVRLYEQAYRRHLGLEPGEEFGPGTPGYFEHDHRRTQMLAAMNRRMTRLFGSVVLLLLAAGETAALWAIAVESTSPFLFASAASAIAAGFTGIVFVAMAGPVPEAAPSQDKS
jgi:hypothetical protein